MAQRGGERPRSGCRRTSKLGNSPDTPSCRRGQSQVYEAIHRGAGNDRAVVGRRRGGGGCRHRRGPSQSCATILARLPRGPPGRPMSLVPRRSSGADRQSSGEPGRLGHQRLPHLLVRPACGRAMSLKTSLREIRHRRRRLRRRRASISAQSRPGVRDLVGVSCSTNAWHTGGAQACED